MQPSVYLPAEGVDRRRDTLRLVRVDERLVDPVVPAVSQLEGVAVDGVKVSVLLRTVDDLCPGCILPDDPSDAIDVTVGQLCRLGKDVAEEGGHDRAAPLKGDLLQEEHQFGAEHHDLVTDVAFKVVHEVRYLLLVVNADGGEEGAVKPGVVGRPVGPQSLLLLPEFQRGDVLVINHVDCIAEEEGKEGFGAVALYPTLPDTRQIGVN